MTESTVELSCPLAAPSTQDITRQRVRIAQAIRESLHAVVALGCAGAAGVIAMAFAHLSPHVAFAAQEIIAFAAFSVGTLMMYERTELRIQATEWADVDLSTRGEVRALLGSLPEGAAYLAALRREGRTFVATEIDRIRARAAFLAEASRNAPSAHAMPQAAEQDAERDYPAGVPALA